ncbi:MAG: hypothetical protein HY903_18870 [Deltaproteobacteria bacterium]|nr:hypothetical protein [Deltaproteobacteria bacterium]
MRKYHTLLVGCLAASACGMGEVSIEGGAPTETKSAVSSTVTIPMRVFSASPSLGAKATSVSDPADPKYGALMVFLEKVQAYSGGEVAFSMANWAATAPNTVLKQVGVNGDPTATGVPRDAAYDNGGVLNSVWGFVYNSTPFGLEFEDMVRFLYEGGGLALAQSLLDGRGLNVKILPVVGSNPQGSGYFKAPIGKVKCHGERDCKEVEGIGLEGLCQTGWIFRYLPPAQDVVARACNQLVAEGVIPAKNISFVASIPGQTVLRSVQLGTVTAFEFATALDDYDPPTAGAGFFPPLTASPIPSTSQNPGHKGLRFAHYPSWHQPFFTGYILLNKSAVWDALTPEQQTAVENAAHDALIESFGASGSAQCGALANILDHNDGQVQLDLNGNPILVDGEPVSADMVLTQWPKDALVRLQAATQAHLEALKGGAIPTADQAEYAIVLAALRSFMADTGFQWKAGKFPKQECHLK